MYFASAIQSTHSTNQLNGSSVVTLNVSQYEESPDDVGDIQCHNCHDVHNMNFAAGDTMNGNPYLRGSWVRNPYPEDGAPQGSGVGSNFANDSRFNTVPRGTTAYNSLGGFQIDQNNMFNGQPPTKGLSLGNSAGLCVLCHGSDVDSLDVSKNGDENLWIGLNGHSNSALGGTADDVDTGTDGDPIYVADVLNFTGTGGRNPSGAPVAYTDMYLQGHNPSMGYQNASQNDGGDSHRGDGFRASYNTFKGYGMTPLTFADYSYVDFDWGVTQDTGTIDKGYHSFTCSKCHNPHASRLPKLLITNCLDTKHNSWDDGGTATGTNYIGNAPNGDNLNQELSNVTSAQNCHRLGDPGTSGTGGGWNKVSPWSPP